MNLNILNMQNRIKSKASSFFFRDFFAFFGVTVVAFILSFAILIRPAFGISMSQYYANILNNNQMYNEADIQLLLYTNYNNDDVYIYKSDVLKRIAGNKDLFDGQFKLLGEELSSHKTILVPVSMNYGGQHFTAAVVTSDDSKNVTIHYNDPMGKKHGEEIKILEQGFVDKGFKVNIVDYSSKIQTDGSSCGGYSYETIKAIYNGIKSGKTKNAIEADIQKIKNTPPAQMRFNHYKILTNQKEHSCSACFNYWFVTGQQLDECPEEHKGAVDNHNNIYHLLAKSHNSGDRHNAAEDYQTYYDGDIGIYEAAITDSMISQVQATSTNLGNRILRRIAAPAAGEYAYFRNYSSATGAWGYFSFGTEKNSSTNIIKQYNSDIKRVIIGYDTEVTDSFDLGLAYSYSFENQSRVHALANRFEIRNHILTPYANYRFSPTIFATSSLSLAKGVINRGKENGQSKMFLASATFDIYKRFTFENEISFIPFVGNAVEYLSQEKHVINNYKVDELEFYALFANGGFSLSKNFDLQNCNFIPQVRISYNKLIASSDGKIIANAENNVLKPVISDFNLNSHGKIRGDIELSFERDSYIFTVGSSLYKQDCTFGKQFFLKIRIK